MSRDSSVSLKWRHVKLCCGGMGREDINSSHGDVTKAKNAQIGGVWGHLPTRNI